MSITHSRQAEFAFSLNTQADIQTSITATDADRILPYRGFGPTMVEFPDTVSDRGWYGKSHSHPTFWDTVTKMTRIPAREYSMTQLSALYAPAFVLGNLASTNPDTGQPTVYDHKFTFQDLATNKECRYTSVIEKVGGEYQNILTGVVWNSFTIDAQRNDHVSISSEGMARKQATNATSLPTIPTDSVYFKVLNATFNFGATGAPAAITGEVLSFNLTASQNVQPLFLPGGAGVATEEHLLAKALIGDQTVSGQFRAFIDSTRRSLFEDETECELTVAFDGGAIGATGLNYTVTIVIPHFKIAAEAFDEEGQTIGYAFNLNEESVLKGASDDFISVTVRSDEPTTDILVDSP